MVVASKEQMINIEGKEISISHPEKPLWPEAGVTKLVYLQYLIDMAPYILPYTKQRLLTVIRYPHGIHDKHFFQKNLPSHAPEWISTSVWENTRYPLLNDLATLVWMANQAALEWHISFHTIENELPTELVFDLDPSTPEFSDAIEAALQLKAVLDELQLPSCIKTSGASGLQVYVPIEIRYSFTQTRQVGQFIATYLTEKYPQKLTIERLIKNRGNKLYIDYLQHWRGKTLPAPYTTRAKEQATVSTPLTWDEVAHIHPTQFTVHTIPERLKRYGDLFKPLRATSQRASLDQILQFLQKRRV